MEEIQNELKLGIGTEEAITLKPSIVKVLSVKIEIVGEKKKAKKIVCEVKHPDKEEPIHISALKFEYKGKLEVSGLWLNTDSKGLIRKGSALAVFLQAVGSKDISGLENREIQTTTDDKGYLCFKAY